MMKRTAKNGKSKFGKKYRHSKPVRGFTVRRKHRGVRISSDQTVDSKAQKTAEALWDLADFFLL